MRPLFLLHFLFFGIVADVSAFCDAPMRFVENPDTSLDTPYQLNPSASYMLQNRCDNQNTFSREFGAQMNDRHVQFELANPPFRPQLSPFDALPVDRGRLSLKIKGDGYTVRFRRHSVSITWTF